MGEDLSSSGLHLKWLQWLGMGQAEAKRQELHLVHIGVQQPKHLDNFLLISQVR